MESKFNGSLAGKIGTNLLCGLIILITLGIATPWAVAKKERWFAKHTIYDGKQVVFDGNGGQLFGKYIVWVLLTIVTLGIYSFWLSLRMHKWVVEHTHLQEIPAPTAAPVQ